MQEDNTRIIKPEVQGSSHQNYSMDDADENQVMREKSAVKDSAVESIIDNAKIEPNLSEMQDSSASSKPKKKKS